MLLEFLSWPIRKTFLTFRRTWKCAYSYQPSLHSTVCTQELECGVVDLLNDAAVRAAEQAMTNNVDVPECPESSNSIEEPVTPKQFGDGFDDHHSREAKVQSRKKQKLIHELD